MSKYKLEVIAEETNKELTDAEEMIVSDDNDYLIFINREKRTIAKVNDNVLDDYLDDDIRNFVRILRVL